MTRNKLLPYLTAPLVFGFSATALGGDPAWIVSDPTRPHIKRQATPIFPSTRLAGHHGGRNATRPDGDVFTTSWPPTVLHLEPKSGFKVAASMPPYVSRDGVTYKFLWVEPDYVEVAIRWTKIQPGVKPEQALESLMKTELTGGSYNPVTSFKKITATEVPGNTDGYRAAHLQRGHSWTHYLEAEVTLNAKKTYIASIVLASNKKLTDSVRKRLFSKFQVAK